MQRNAKETTWTRKAARPTILRHEDPHVNIRIRRREHDDLEDLKAAGRVLLGRTLSHADVFRFLVAHGLREPEKMFRADE
ncbi:MAG: hypothetical protein ACYDCK_05470 [Thermoplasmatota archaeon]